METQYLEVGDNKWGVLVCYDYTMLDWDDMWAIMRSFGVSNAKANEAIGVLGGLNTGMAISNDDIRMSVVFVSDATSASEWWSTLSHELYHVSAAIIDYYGESYEREPAAYLYGELIRMAVQNISEPCYV